MASSVPVRVVGIDTAVTIAAGGTWNAGGKGAANSTFNCAVLRDGSVQCWGEFPGNLGGAVPVVVPGVHAALSVAGGNWHACALTLGGSIQCWGNNVYGQLGNASVTDSNAPTTVVGINEAVDVVGLGSNFTCALLKAGSVECWGELGLAHISSALGSTPVPIPIAGPPATRIAAGYEHACAVLADGQVQCWGDGPPAIVPGVGAGVAVAVGKSHACALRSDGTIQCWGENQFGQLGRRSDDLATVSQLHDAVAVSAGYNYSCALSKGGAAWCWGVNLTGQLGDGEDLTVEHKEPHYEPVRVRGL
jgi:alpha-tubulin suppressor-like RCC1 family protein